MGANQSNRRELKLENVTTTSKNNNKTIGNSKSSKLRSSLRDAIKTSSSTSSNQHSCNEQHEINSKQLNVFNEMFVAEREVVKTGVSSKSSKGDNNNIKSSKKQINFNNNNDDSETDRNEPQFDDSFGFEPNKLHLTNSMKHSNQNNNSSQYYHTASLKKAAAEAQSQQVNSRDYNDHNMIPTEIFKKSRGNLYVDDPSANNKHNTSLSKTPAPSDLNRYYLNEANMIQSRDDQYHYDNQHHHQMNNNPYQHQIQQVGYDPVEMAQLQKLTQNPNLNNNNRRGSSMGADVGVNCGVINNKKARESTKINIDTSNYSAGNDIGDERSYASFRDDYEEYYYHGDNEMESNNEVLQPVDVAAPVKIRGCNKEEHQQQRSSSLTSTISSSESTSAPAKNNNNKSKSIKKLARSKLSPPTSTAAATMMDSNNKSNNTKDVVRNIYVKVSPTLAKKYINNNSNHGNQLGQGNLNLDGKFIYDNNKINNSYHDFSDDYHREAFNVALNHENDDDMIIADNSLCCDEIIEKHSNVNPNEIYGDDHDERKQNRKINLNQYIITHNELSKSSPAVAAAVAAAEEEEATAAMISMKKKPATVNGKLVAKNKNEQSYQFPYQQQQAPIYNYHHQQHSNKLNYEPYNSSQQEQEISTPINAITNSSQICNNKQLFITENHLNYPPYQRQQALNGCIMSTSNGHYNNNHLNRIDQFQHRHQMASNNQYIYDPYANIPAANYHINNNQYKPSSSINHQQQIPMSYVYQNQQQQAPLLDFHRYSANAVPQQASSRNHQLLINNNYYQHQNPSISHKFEAANNLLPSNQNHQHQAYLTGNDNDLQLCQYNTNATNKATNYNDKKAAQSTSSRLSWFGSKSSQTLDTRSSNYKKSSNPFASLFGGATSKFTDNNSKHHHQQYSNTIHLGRSSSNNKASVANLMGISSPNQQQQSNQRSAPGSLKRIKSSPLTAQQASYEAMRTIDMYLIRQIARSCMVSNGKFLLLFRSCLYSESESLT